MARPAVALEAERPSCCRRLIIVTDTKYQHEKQRFHAVSHAASQPEGCGAGHRLHSTALPKHVVDYHGWVNENHARAGYMMSDFQGQCHVILARVIGARRILEIGVYVGYSALVWAHAVGGDGSVTGLEVMANEAPQRNGVANVQVIKGDGLEALAKLEPKEPYDLVFIDAQKSGHPSYLANILASSKPRSAALLLRPGGLIVADNVLRRGLVADDGDDNPWASQERKQRNRSEYETDRDLECLREFNAAVRGSERFESFFLTPLYDGMGLARLIDQRAWLGCLCLVLVMEEHHTWHGAPIFNNDASPNNRGEGNPKGYTHLLVHGPEPLARAGWGDAYRRARATNERNGGASWSKQANLFTQLRSPGPPPSMTFPRVCKRAVSCIAGWVSRAPVLLRCLCLMSTVFAWETGTNLPRPASLNEKKGHRGAQPTAATPARGGRRFAWLLRGLQAPCATPQQPPRRRRILFSRREEPSGCLPVCESSGVVAQRRSHRGRNKPASEEAALECGANSADQGGGVV
ncbi:Uncharacterized protein TCAP_03807 [Tolypocladium capitatum]|uniref:O-methyltransferase MdmC n=1 Tax=Tolypocladium capitatum TaxID=45235 RepID=A0A2K3QFE6_9HYPO|nr:Uncharacterized protein TCAP_03807 [Tolypocladium capitatum]